jgi:integrase
VSVSVKNPKTGDWQEPAGNWGELRFSTAAPEADAEWTDDGLRRDHRHLKSRPVGEWRRVSAQPPPTRLLHSHLRDFGGAPGGRVFAGVQGGELASITYRRSWGKARRDTLSAAEAASPLAGRVYDLRHACVSTWLNGGIPPAQVAERAGHSVAILRKIYAKCLDGQDAIAKRRMEEALGDPGEDGAAESPGEDGDGG